MSRAEDAARRAELAASSDRAESAAAQKLIDQFLVDARAAGLSPEPLRATLFGGSSAATVRTDKVGWYLRNNRSVAIGEDGSYYVLVVAGGLAERVRGVKLTASPPPLIIGKGGRDGESGDLADYLHKRLAAD
ncbi:MAG: hypothetical protein ACR2LI_02370 [Propionibacteriaceae bacterium]